MALDGCGLVCKYILIFFNIIFTLVGTAFLGIGLWLRLSSSTRGIFEIEALNSSAFVMVVTILIALGSVMLIVVMFGDYGACNEKRCPLQVFSALLSILAIAVVVFGVLAYANRDEVASSFVEFYSSMYTLYLTSGGDPVIAVTLTFIHNTLQCCGMTGVKLIELAQQTCPQKAWFMSDCPSTIATVFDSRAPLVMGVFVGTGVLLIVALVSSIILLKQTKKDEQEFTARYSTVY